MTTKSSNPTTRNRTIDIAGVTIAITFTDKLWQPREDEAHSWFLSDKQPQVTLKAHYSGIPDIDLGQEVFDSEGSWKLYKNGEKNIIYISSKEVDPPVVMVGVFSDDYTSGDVYLSFPDTSDGRVSYPLVYPLEELIMVNLLARGRGVIIHSCGVSREGKGILFSGVSGAGKSTLANLWKNREAAKLLSDDRTIIRKIDGRVCMFGTPWHGDAKVASPEGVPLERIFIIKHSPKNYASLLRASDAASALFVRCFPTFWNPAGMTYTLSLLSEITEQVPCYELGFVPDETVLDFVIKQEYDGV
jgi:hypothetical protein